MVVLTDLRKELLSPGPLGKPCYPKDSNLIQGRLIRLTSISCDGDSFSGGGQLTFCDYDSLSCELVPVATSERPPPNLTKPTLQ